MLDHLKLLEREGRWNEIRQQAAELLSSATDDNRARVLASISTAFFATAAGGDDLRTALSYAEQAERLVQPDTPLGVYLKQKLSSLNVDLGRFKVAKRYALDYLCHPHVYQDLTTATTAYVYRDLGHIAASERKYHIAAAYFKRALVVFSDGVERDRTLTNLVWALAKSGRVTDARRVLDSIPTTEENYLRYGAEALVLSAEGRLLDALEAGQKALALARRTHDFVDAANVALILSSILRRLNQTDRAYALRELAIQYAVRQGVSALALSALNLRWEGGDGNKEGLLRSSSRCAFGDCFTTAVG